MLYTTILLSICGDYNVEPDAEQHYQTQIFLSHTHLHSHVHMHLSKILVINTMSLSVENIINKKAGNAKEVFFLTLKLQNL